MHVRIALASAGALAAILSLPLHAAAPQPLESALSRLDRASASFKSVTANVRMVNHTAVINENTEDDGTMYLKRVRPGEMRMLVNITKPDPKALAVDGRKGMAYYPKIQTVQEWDLGKYRGLVDQFMLLGFGSSSKDLQTAYTIRAIGTQNVGGQPATQLELIPKSKQVLDYLTKVELWVGDAGYPAQQKFYMPGGDYRLVTFSDTKINPNLPDSAFKLQLPKGVKRETPQKQ